MIYEKTYPDLDSYQEDLNRINLLDSSHISYISSSDKLIFDSKNVVIDRYSVSIGDIYCWDSIQNSYIFLKSKTLDHLICNKLIPIGVSITTGGKVIKILSLKNIESLTQWSSSSIQQLTSNLQLKLSSGINSDFAGINFINFELSCQNGIEEFGIVSKEIFDNTIDKFQTYGVTTWISYVNKFMVKYPSGIGAILNKDGKGNTDLLYFNGLSSHNTAATNCKLYSIEHSLDSWYLPSLFDWYLIGINFDLINESLSSMNHFANPFTEYKYWTSTERSATKSYCYDIISGYINSELKSNKFLVRAIKTI